MTGLLVLCRLLLVLLGFVAGRTWRAALRGSPEVMDGCLCVLVRCHILRKIGTRERDKRRKEVEKKEHVLYVG